MKNLIIIGAGGFGREVYNLSLVCKGHNTLYKVKGFLDDNPAALDKFQGYPPVIGSIGEYRIKPDDVFVCAMGAPLYKKECSEEILNKGGEFITLIHPSSGCWPNTTIGMGCVIFKDVGISCDVQIGDFVSIQGATIIGHDAKIGDWTVLGNRTFFGGAAEIEAEAIIHTGAIILPKKKVGHGAVVGAGAVVVRDVKPGTTVYGNPATRLR